MNLKKILKYALVIVLVIQFISCNKDNDAEAKFSQAPTERIEARKKELQDLLMSSQNGWKAVYFTDNTQLGGFTHVFKFKDAQHVDMASDYESPDYAPDTKIYESEYAIQVGSTVSLVFTTKNRIHFLSDADYYPTGDLRAQGYKGDFQFLYYGYDIEKGEIIFKSNRSFQELRFIKASAQDWTDLDANIAMIENVVGAPTRPLFRFLETNNGATKLQFDFAYNKISRFATTSPLVEGVTVAYDFGVGYKPTGITISPAIEIEGQKLTDFVYDSASGNFTATGKNNVSAAIKYSSKPLVLTDDYKELLAGNNLTRFAYFDANLADAPTNSALFISLFKKVNSQLPATTQLVQIRFFFNDSGYNYIRYSFSGGKTAVYHNIDTAEDAVNKRILFTDISWESNTGAPLATPAYLKNLDDQFMDPAGFYIKKENFQITFSNTIYTFTSASNPFRMTTYALQ